MFPEKEGQTGKLAFVTVAHRIRQDGEVCIEEEQDIVYREPRGLSAPPSPANTRRPRQVRGRG